MKNPSTKCRTTLSAATLGLFAMMHSPATAQNYPSTGVKLIVPVPAG